MTTTGTIPAVSSAADVFDPMAVRDLPDPARRWLRHSIAAGSTLIRHADLDLAGRIKLGRWRPYEARQRIDALDAYVWEEHTSLLGASVRGHDSLINGQGEMRHDAFGHVPLVDQRGPDVTRSAYARLACELVYTPAGALDDRVTWDQTGWNLAVARIALPGESVDVTLHVTSHGVLTSLWCRRWAKQPHHAWQLTWFHFDVLAQGTIEGTVFPRRILAGYASDAQRWPAGAFIEQSVLDYRPSALPLLSGPHDS